MDAQAHGSMTPNSENAPMTSPATICASSPASSSDLVGEIQVIQHTTHPQTNRLNSPDPGRPSGTRDIGAATACNNPAAEAAGEHASQQGAASLTDAACQETVWASARTATSSHVGAAAEPSHDLGRPRSSLAASLPSVAHQGRASLAPLTQDAAPRPISAADFEVAMQRIRPSITRDFSIELTPGRLPTLQNILAMQTFCPCQPW